MRQKIRSRRFFSRLLRGLLPALLIIGLAAGGYVFFSRNFLFLDGTLYRRDITQLDLAGKPVEQFDRIPELTGLRQLDLRDTGISAGEYEKIRAALPECEILWNPCFQGQFYPQDTQSLTVSRLTEADVVYLDYFPALTQVDALQCRDYDAIMALIRRRPECRVAYQVLIGGEQYLPEADFLAVTDASPRELAVALRYLPNVTGVLFTGTPVDLVDYQDLSADYPDIIFDYEVAFQGLILPSNLAQADFSGLDLTRTEALEALLPCLPDLQRVDVTGCAIPHEQMASLSRRWPEISFAWNVMLGDTVLTTDAEVIDLSGKYIGDAALVDSLLPFFPRLEKLILCDCGISNEDMAALRDKYPDIQIVWSVRLGDEMTVRTDITTFMPVKYGVWMEDDDTYNLRYCTEIVALDMGHMDIRNIDFVAFMPKLKYLLLCDSWVDNLEPLRGLPELMYVELFLTRVTDYSPLVDCPALEDLNISWTYGSYVPLTKMTGLKRLWWGGTGHSYAEVQQLTQCLPNAQLVLYDGDSTGSGWRKHPHYYEMRNMLGMYYME